MKRAPDDLVFAAKEFVRALKTAFAADEGVDIVAAWSKSGLLVIGARGHKAHALDCFLRDNGYAVPNNREHVEVEA